eukprot:scaffold301_cov243-Pinguiococcus_pyrenoidosus.AAC.27
MCGDAAVHVPGFVRAGQKVSQGESVQPGFPSTEFNYQWYEARFPLVRTASSSSQSSRGW